MKIPGLVDWTPAGFAFLLSGLEFYMSFESGRPMGEMVIFVAFIPMCFFFLGNALMHYRKRIEALEARIAELQEQKNP